MSDFRIQQALNEMRAIGGQAVEKPQEESASPVEDFSSVLRDAVEHVNEQQVDAQGMQDAFMSGEDVQLTDVMMSAQKANVSFEAMKEVRNQFLEAYQEISNMQV